MIMLLLRVQSCKCHGIFAVEIHLFWLKQKSFGKVCSFELSAGLFVINCIVFYKIWLFEHLYIVIFYLLIFFYRIDNLCLPFFPHLVRSSTITNYVGQDTVLLFDLFILRMQKKKKKWCVVLYIWYLDICMKYVIISTEVDFVGFHGCLHRTPPHTQFVTK